MKQKQHDPERIFSLKKRIARQSDLKFLQDPCIRSEENGFASKTPIIWVSCEVSGVCNHSAAASSKMPRGRCLSPHFRHPHC